MVEKSQQLSIRLLKLFHISRVLLQPGWLSGLQLLFRMCEYFSVVLSFSLDSGTTGHTPLNTKYSEPHW